MVNAMHLRLFRNLLDVTDKDYLLMREKKDTNKIKVKRLKEHHLRRITITNLS